MTSLLKTLVTTHKKKYRSCIGIKYNPSSGQNTGLQKKVDTTYKQYSSLLITEDKKNHRPKDRRNMGRPLKRLLDT
jgi:hypothetical protein